VAWWQTIVFILTYDYVHGSTEKSYLLDIFAPTGSEKS